MRSRKKVAVYCSNVLEAERLGFVLGLRLRVAPLECATVDELLATEHEVAVLMPSDLRQVEELRSACHMLPARKLLLDHTAFGPAVLPVDLRLSISASRAEVLAAVRQLLPRKRGPRPGGASSRS